MLIMTAASPIFCLKKVKDSEARLAPPLLTQEIIIMIVVVRLKKVIKKVVSKPKNINRTLVNQESIIMPVVVIDNTLGGTYLVIRNYLRLVQWSDFPFTIKVICVFLFLV